MEELFPGVELAEDERTLWAGRPGFGISRFELMRLLRSGASVAVTGFMIVCAYFLITLADELTLERAAFVCVVALFLSVVPTLLVTIAIVLAKVSQASAASTTIVIFCVPLLSLMWGGLVADYGLAAAFKALVNSEIACCFLILGVPLVPASVDLGRKVLAQVHTRYYLTSARYFEIRERRHGVAIVQQGPVPTGWIQVRAIPLGKGVRGHVALGTGRQRVLFRFVDHPKLVVEEIRRELGQPEHPPDSSVEPVPDPEAPEDGDEG